MINLAPPPFKRRHFFTLFGRAALLGGSVDTARERPGRSDVPGDIRVGQFASPSPRAICTTVELH
jgi:hypothetical protein